MTKGYTQFEPAATKQVRFHSSRSLADASKWHVMTVSGRRSKCGVWKSFDRENAIVVEIGDTQVHPLACKRCLRAALKPERMWVQ